VFVAVMVGTVGGAYGFIQEIKRKINMRGFLTFFHVMLQFMIF